MKEEKEKKKDHRKALMVWTIIVSVVLFVAIVLSAVFIYNLTDEYSNIYGLYPDEVLSVSEGEPDENGVVTLYISEVKNGKRTDYEEYIAPDGSLYDFYPYYVSIDMGQGSLFEIDLVFEEKPSKDDLYFNSYPKAVSTCANVSSMYFTENYFWYFDGELCDLYPDRYFQEEIKTGDTYELFFSEDSLRYDVSGFFRDGFYTLSAKVEGREYGYDFYLDTNSPVMTDYIKTNDSPTWFDGCYQNLVYGSAFWCQSSSGPVYTDTVISYVNHDYGVGYESAYCWYTFFDSVVKEDFEYRDEFIEWIDETAETYIESSDDLYDGMFGYTLKTKEEYEELYSGNGPEEYPETTFGLLFRAWNCWGQYLDPYPNHGLHCYLVDLAGNVVDWYDFKLVGRI